MKKYQVPVQKAALFAIRSIGSSHYHGQIQQKIA